MAEGTLKLLIFPSYILSTGSVAGVLGLSFYCCTPQKEPSIAPCSPRRGSDGSRGLSHHVQREKNKI